MTFSLSGSLVFAGDFKSTAISDKKENKLTAEEVARLKNRVEEIRDMDKSHLTIQEKRELKTELKTIKKKMWRDGGYVYIGTGTLILIIILIILLV